MAADTGRQRQAGATRKQLVIKPLKLRPQLPDDFERVTWAKLQVSWRSGCPACGLTRVTCGVIGPGGWAQWHMRGAGSGAAAAPSGIGRCWICWWQEQANQAVERALHACRGPANLGARAAALPHPPARPAPCDCLQAAVHAVQQHTPVSCSLEELYRAVEDMCLHKLAPKLYGLLQEECNQHSAQQVCVMFLAVGARR